MEEEKSHGEKTKYFYLRPGRGQEGPMQRIEMRKCDDVPKFIKRLKAAHEATKDSTLHFGGNYSSVRSPDYSPEDYSQPPRA